MQRMLVWPWHGLIKDGAVQLKDGSIRAYNQPLNFPTAQYGSGDTHKIVVPNIEPLSDAEISQAPAGGEYWAGQALISAGSLYNKIINGWIYQALDGSRWQISVLNRTLTDTDATLQLRASLFGEFGRAGETHTTTLTVPVGRLSDMQQRSSLFLSQIGATSSSVIRLHSISETGRTAIFAWMAYNDVGQNENYQKVYDFRPRAFMYYKVSVAGSHEALEIKGEVVFDFDDIYKYEESTSGQFGLRGSYGSPPSNVETEREPLYNSDGVYVGDKVTYEFSKEVPIVYDTVGIWDAPVAEFYKTKWMIMLCFVGEEPIPIYLSVEYDLNRGAASFQRVTDEKIVINEYFTGEIDIREHGKSHLVGGAGSSGTSTLTLSGAGQQWATQISASTFTRINGSVGTTTDVVDEKSETRTGDGVFLGQGMPTGSVGYGSPGSNVVGVPVADLGVNGIGKYFKIFLYSNNMIAVASGDYAHGELQRDEIIGFFTLDGFTSQRMSYPTDDVRHFGSYNPFTKECVIGSPAPINWV